MIIIIFNIFKSKIKICKTSTKIKQMYKNTGKRYDKIKEKDPMMINHQSSKMSGKIGVKRPKN